MTQTPPGTPPAGDPGSTPPAPGGPPDPQAGEGLEPISLDEARKLRSEARSLRQRLKAIDDAQAAADLAKLSELDQAKKSHSDLQAKYEADTQALINRIVALEVRSVAARLGIIDPDAAVRLIDDEFEVDDDGNVKNAEALLKDLLKAKPYLAGGPRQTPTASAGGATNPPRSASGGFSQITRDNLAEAMAQYDKLAPAQQREVTRLLTGR